MSPSPYSRKIGRLQLTVVLGDITEQATDAIVNAANNHLWMGSGVAGAIKAKGGEEIEREAMKLGPIEPGQAVTTSAGRLKARYCIHAAAMGQDLATSADLITKATRSALAEATRLGLDSSSIPRARHRGRRFSCRSLRAPDDCRRAQPQPHQPETRARWPLSCATNRRSARSPMP